jgi:hypothetical protein
LLYCAGKTIFQPGRFSQNILKTDDTDDKPIRLEALGESGALLNNIWTKAVCGTLNAELSNKYRGGTSESLKFPQI